MTNHTPGPWKITLSAPNGQGSHKHQIGTSEKTVGYAWLPMDGNGNLLGSGDEHYANARLFAAAPDLLEAAEEAFHAIMRSGPSIKHDPEILKIHKLALDKLCKSLTKATGGENV